MQKKQTVSGDYFILLRKFIDYYHNDIGDSIKKKMHMNPNKCVYILLINESKKIYKFGRSSDLRKRLRNYATGIEKHPDIKFIMIVENPMLVEKCVKELISNFQFKERQEKYQVTHDLIKKVIFECAELHDNFKKINISNTENAYIVFDDYDHEIDVKTKSANGSKNTSKKTSKNKSKNAPKKISKNKSKKNFKKNIKKNFQKDIKVWI